jgi:hypothetical protein
MASMFAGCAKVDLLNTWAGALAGVPAENVRQALQNVARAHPSWPPTLGEFLALCAPPAPVLALHRPLLPDRRPREPIAPEVQAKLDAFVAKARQA